MILLRSLLACFFAIASCTVAAANPVDLEQRLTPEQLRTLALTPEQLSLLNGYLREEAARTPVAEAVPVGAGRPVERDASGMIGLDDAPIKSRLKGTIREWGPGYVFELENGQRWKVLKGSARLHRQLENPEVTVVPGVAGRWFMQVDEDTARPRVYRID